MWFDELITNSERYCRENPHLFPLDPNNHVPGYLNQLQKIRNKLAKDYEKYIGE